MRLTNLIGVMVVTAMLGLGVPPEDAGAANNEDAASQEAEREKFARIARGARHWAQHCKRCHNLRNGAEMTDAEWEVVVTHMRVRANLPGQLARDVMLFLKESN